MRHVGTRAEPLVLLGEPTIYLALPLVCAHWAIIRGRAEPPYLCSHGLMSPGAVVVYRPKDPHELFICYSLFMPRTCLQGEQWNKTPACPRHRLRRKRNGNITHALLRLAGSSFYGNGEIQRNENQVDEVSLLDRPQGRTGMAISRDSALADRKISW